MIRMSDFLSKLRNISQGQELKIAIVLAILGGILTTVAFVMAFTTANMQYHDFTVNLPTFQTNPETRIPLATPEFQPQPPDGTVNYLNPWFSQKIFYFHVPVAWLSLMMFTLSAIFAAIFLKTRNPKSDLRSRIGMETTLIFTLGTMISGSMWTRAAWVNSWGEMAGKLLSEPRLVTYTVMLMFVVAYFVLRRSVDGEEKKATYGAVFTLLAWLIVPFSYAFTRLTQHTIPQAHPADALNTGMDPSNLLPFIVCIFGMSMLGYAIYTLRVAEEKKRMQLEVIKEDLEDALSDSHKQVGHADLMQQYSAAAVLGTATDKTENKEA